MRFSKLSKKLKYYISSAFKAKTGEPLGGEDGTPREQGEFYCGVGAGNVVGRAISDAHLKACIDLGITLTGTNAEVALGQWEYQCFEKVLKQLMMYG